MPTDGTTVVSTLTTIVDDNYTIRVSGQFTNSANKVADAEWVVRNTNRNRLNCGGGSVDIGLKIDDPSPPGPTKNPDFWGPYTASHVYTTMLKGTGNPLEFTYNDCDYSDNTGTLTVEILCPTLGSSPVGTVVVGTNPQRVQSPAPPSTTPVPTEVTGPLTCAAGQLPCAGRCIAAAECPPNECCLDADDCACVCPDCLDNFVFDPATCGCVCPPRECPVNLIFDAATCDCLCSPTPCAPGSGWQFDQTTCSCICPPQACPPNFLFDEASCSCVCIPVDCPGAAEFDVATCSCICLPPPCPPNYQFDQASCSCFCAEVGCAEGEVFDRGSCLCVSTGGAGDAQESA